MAGDSHGGPTTYGSLSPEGALGLLGNQVRAEILWALSEARGEDGPPALSFSDLRERVADRREARAHEARDPDPPDPIDSSQFNYYLQQLVGHFVERRGEDGTAESQPVAEMAGDHGDGYALRPERTILTRTIRSLTFSGDATRDPGRTGLLLLRGARRGGLRERRLQDTVSRLRVPLRLQPHAAGRHRRRRRDDALPGGAVQPPRPAGVRRRRLSVLRGRRRPHVQGPGWQRLPPQRPPRDAPPAGVSPLREHGQPH